MSSVLETAVLPPAPDARDLTAASLRTLHAALPELYATTDQAQLPRVFTDVLARLVPGDSHGVVVHDRAQGRRYWHLRPAVAEHEKLVPVFFANFHEFTPAGYRRRTGTGEALALSDFVSTAEADRLAIYGDYYKRLGIADDLNINVQHGQVVTCAAVLRGQRGFRRDERALLNALRPHFRQAWATAEMITSLAAARAATPVAAGEWSPERLEVRYGLTPREAETLIWVAQGKTNPEIAGILGISAHTVRTHLERTFAKLGVETRHAAGLCAIEVLGLPR
jgi:DNA-binding CsgD family transcriptional regulator